MMMRLSPAHWHASLAGLGFIFLCSIAAPSRAAGPALQPAPVHSPERTGRVSFYREVLPVLQSNCLPCHNQTRAKAGLILETPQTMLEGGENGPSIVPGRPAESLIVRAAAHLDEDLIMPPSENKVNARALTPDQLRLVQLWIEQGAEADAIETNVLAWKPIPTNVISSFAVALTADGRSAAIARANRVTLYDVKTGRVTGQLADPELGGAAQRDWVNALAFSPDDKLLAAAGFREVRLWKRQPARTDVVFAPEEGSSWLAAAISPSGERVALVAAHGAVEVRRIRDGQLLGSWPLQLPCNVRLAWGSDLWLAAAGTNGVIQVVALESSPRSLGLNVSGEVTAIEWFEHDRRLAIAVQGSELIQNFERVEQNGSVTFEPRPMLTGHEAAITALAAARNDDGSLVSADADGVVRLWSSKSKDQSAELRLPSSAIRLASLRGLSLAAALAAGGAAKIEFGDPPRMGQPFGADPRLSARLDAESDEIALSRLELARAEALVKEADAAAKSGEEALAKAREKHAADGKALADTERELTEQQEIETAATKERDELGAELQRVTDASQAAEKRLAEARDLAELAAEKDAAARIAAVKADQLKAELERVLSEFPDSADGSLAEKARAAAAAAADEAASLAAVRVEATAAAARAREELAERAFGAGRCKADLDRGQAELPPRKKRAEERLAAAQKAIPGLQTRVDKARIKLDGRAQDVTLAEASIARAAELRKAAQAAFDAAGKRIAAAEARVNELEEKLARIMSQPPAQLAVASDGASLVVVQQDGLASVWDAGAGEATAAFLLENGAPLAIAGMENGEFLTVFSNAVTRVNASMPWALHRVIGGRTDAREALFVDRVNALAFSPDGELLATGGGEPSRSGELKLWRAGGGELVRDFGAVHSDCVMAVAFSPRGHRLATGGADRFARITPVSGQGERVDLEGHTHHVLGVAWLGDGETLASAGADGVVKIWNLRTGERRKNVEGFGKEVTGVARAGFGNEFIAVAGSGSGWIFNADGGKVRDLTSAGVFLQALSVSRNGKVAAGAGEDGTLRIWNTADGKETLKVLP